MIKLPLEFEELQYWVAQFLPAYLYLFQPDTARLVRWASLLPLRHGANVLDIGTGAGVFPWVLQQYCPGIEVTVTNALGVSGREQAYAKSLALLGMEAQSFLVRRQQPLGLSCQYDVISSLRASFCGGWSAADWRFFIDDVLGYLRPGGCLFLWLNQKEHALSSFRALRSMGLKTWIEPDVLLLRRAAV